MTSGGDHRQRPAVERAFESEGAIALGMTVDRLTPARHFDRSLVGLSAGIGEENQIGESRLGEAPRKALALGILIEVRNVPQLRALVGQRLDEVGMGVTNRGDRDAGTEVEITLPGDRGEPAALAALESDIGPGIRRDHGGSRVGEGHLINSL